MKTSAIYSIDSLKEHTVYCIMFIFSDKSFSVLVWSLTLKFLKSSMLLDSIRNTT